MTIKAVYGGDEGTCKECIFRDKDETCRINPPVVMLESTETNGDFVNFNYITLFPKVRDNDWCIKGCKP